VVYPILEMPHERIESSHYLKRSGEFGIFTHSSNFRMIPVVQKRQMHSFDEGQEDVAYWLSRPAKERVAAVTFIIFQTIDPTSRLDKTFISKREIALKEDQNNYFMQPRSDLYV
jgi:hypothetical protein